MPVSGASARIGIIPQVLRARPSPHTHPYLWQHARHRGLRMTDKKVRIERDSMGELRVPAEALWGAQTQRAVQNFPLSGLRMPRAFICALGLIKEAAAGANQELGQLDAPLAVGIATAARAVADGKHDTQFPI